MSNVVSFDAAKSRHRVTYVDTAKIEEACATLEAAVLKIANGSMTAYGAIDPLAYEINAHLNAILRAVEFEMPEGDPRGK